MSLKGLMWHKFSIQSNEGQGKTSYGGVLRHGWPIIHLNIPCQIQGVRKEDKVEELGIEESLNLWVCYFIREDIEIDESMRFITAKSFKSRIDTFEVTEQNASDYRIFIYKGKRVQVETRKTKITEIFMEETTRFEVA